MIVMVEIEHEHPAECGHCVGGLNEFGICKACRGSGYHPSKSVTDSRLVMVGYRRPDFSDLMFLWGDSTCGWCGADLIELAKEHLDQAQNDADDRGK
jgi:hypothetical protein